MPRNSPSEGHDARGDTAPGVAVRRVCDGNTSDGRYAVIRAGWVGEVIVKTVLHANEVVVGYHPAGFRIDKTATPMHRYTQWRILDDGCWVDPRPVCFHALPEEGWVAVERFTRAEEHHTP